MYLDNTPKYTQKFFSFDVSVSIAAKFLGIDDSVIHKKSPFYFTRMKPALQGWEPVPGSWLTQTLVHFTNNKELFLNNDPDMLVRYQEQLKFCVDEYIKKYPYCNYYSPFSDKEVTNIQYYPPNGGYFKWHTERSSSEFLFSARHLVFMTYLNDVNEDGETEFYHQKIKVKPEKGLTLIWPADWTFTHRGIPSPHEKYIVTGWLHYD
jgi:hypothetical protein